MTQRAARRHAPTARHAARRRPLRRALTALGVIAAVLLVTGSVSAFVIYQRLNGNINKVAVDNLIGEPSTRPTKVAANPKAENILIMGSDKRSGASAVNVPGERSDTTILLHLAADRNSATGVSIPRDSIVDIPACTKPDGTAVAARPKTMFNDSFADGGAACTIKTVESLTKIRIDHYVVVDFHGFKDMVNALGGVRVCIPYDVNDPQSHLVLSKGFHTVRGNQALAYVRTRHGLGDGGDISRIDRQQAFLSSMIKKVKSTGLLLNPVRLISFLDAATKSLTTDPSLGDLNSLRVLAQDVKGMPTDAVTFLTIPNEPYVLDPNRVQWKKSAAAVWTSIRYDEALPGKATPSLSQSASPSGGGSPTPTGPPLVTAPSAIKVQVLDGAGDLAAAQKIADNLTAQGFQVVSVTVDPRGATTTTTTVRHDPAYDQSGRTLGAALPGATVTADASLGATLVVTIGSDSPRVATVSVGGSSASPSPTETLQTRSASQNICS